MTNSPVYIFNTEKNITTDKKFDEYYLLPAGFMDAFVVTDLHRKIIYYDNNITALYFKKYLIEHWDTTKKSLWHIINDLKYNYSYSDYGIANFNELTNKEKFDLNWNKLSNNDVFEKFNMIKYQARITYQVFDIVMNPMLCTLVEYNATKKYFWFSNCFDYAHTHTTEQQRNSYKIFNSSAKRHGLFIHGVDPIIDDDVYGFL